MINPESFYSSDEAFEKGKKLFAEMKANAQILVDKGPEHERILQETDAELQMVQTVPNKPTERTRETKPKFVPRSAMAHQHDWLEEQDRKLD